MACAAAQFVLCASSCCRALPRRPQRLGVKVGGVSGAGSGRACTLSCNAASSPPPPPKFSPDESDCSTETGERSPEEEVGDLSAELLAGERSKVAGTVPSKKKGWTGYVEKDTAGQTNVYSVEPTVYVAENAISSGSAGTAAVTAGIALFSIAAASAVLLQVGKSQPQVQGPEDYSGPPLSYYITKFRSAQQTVAASFAAPELQSGPSVEASGSSSTVGASAPPDVQQPSSSAQVEAGSMAATEASCRSKPRKPSLHVA